MRSSGVHGTSRRHAGQLFERYLNVKSTLYKFAPLMRKVIIGFILAQCFLLVDGSDHLYGYASQDCSYSSLILTNSLEAKAIAIKDIRSFVCCSEQPLKIEIAEIEEEKYKLTSFKKFLTGFNFFTILLPEQTPGHFFAHTDNDESFAEPIHELASNSRYATFRVFRI